MQNHHYAYMHKELTTDSPRKEQFINVANYKRQNMAYTRETEKKRSKYCMHNKLPIYR
jgi:hypothetical protein